MRKIDAGEIAARISPEKPETAVNSDGTIVGPHIMFATRNWQGWAKSALKSPVLLEKYGAKRLDRMIKDMALTAAIFGDYNTVPEEIKGSPMRKNSDPLFNDTLDSMTVCPQQDQYVAQVRALQHHYGRLFTKEERAAVNVLMDDVRGYLRDPELGKPSCWYCYGQASRDTVANLLNKMQRSFGALQESHGKGEHDRLVRVINRAMPDDPVKAKQLRRAQQEAKRRLADMYGRVENERLKSGFEQPLSWQGRKTKPLSAWAEYGKKYHNNAEAAALWQNMPRVHDLAMGYEEPQTDLERETVKTLRASMSTAQVNLPKGFAPYTNQILRRRKSAIERDNRSAGMRMNSQADFAPWQTNEIRQQLIHAAAVGQMMHVYTRQPEFLEYAGGTGIKFNISVGYALDMHGRVMKDAKGAVYDMIGMDREKAHYYRKKFSRDVGTMLVAINDDALETGLNDENIDMIIPYHAGAVPAIVDEYRHAKNYEDWQHEHWDHFEPNTKVVHNKKEEPAKTITLSDGASMTIRLQQPITREHHGDNAQRYFEICEKLGITPRFQGVKLSDGTDVTQHKNYMKLVRDVARNPMKQVVPDATKLDTAAEARMVSAYVDQGGHPKHIEAHPQLLELLKMAIDEGRLKTALHRPRGNFVPEQHLQQSKTRRTA